MWTAVSITAKVRDVWDEPQMSKPSAAKTKLCVQCVRNEHPVPQKLRACGAKGWSSCFSSRVQGELARPPEEAGVGAAAGAAAADAAEAAAAGCTPCLTSSCIAAALSRPAMPTAALDSAPSPQACRIRKNEA